MSTIRTSFMNTISLSSLRSTSMSIINLSSMRNILLWSKRNMFLSLQNNILIKLMLKKDKTLWLRSLRSLWKKKFLFSRWSRKSILIQLLRNKVPNLVVKMINLCLQDSKTKDFKTNQQDKCKELWSKRPLLLMLQERQATLVRAFLTKKAILEISRTMDSSNKSLMNSVGPKNKDSSRTWNQRWQVRTKNLNTSELFDLHRWFLVSKQYY